MMAHMRRPIPASRAPIRGRERPSRIGAARPRAMRTSRVASTGMSHFSVTLFNGGPFRSCITIMRLTSGMPSELTALSRSSARMIGRNSSAQRSIGLSPAGPRMKSTPMAPVMVPASDIRVRSRYVRLFIFPLLMAAMAPSLASSTKSRIRVQQLLRKCRYW